ncbi:MAG: prepilin-type N-terminal cleavage/methylation domain-containing protein [Patescibacteria group bacterium]
MKISNSGLNDGFTLVELMVAMSLFLVAVTISSGAFVRSLRTQRAANQIMSVNSNASLVVEQISREIRSGYNFTLNNFPTSLCGTGQFDELKFTNSKSKGVTYHLQSNAIERRECDAAGCTTEPFYVLTPPNVSVSRLCFVNTQLPTTNDSWRITVFSKFGPSDPQLSGNTVDFQTTISGRILPSEIQ